MFNACFMRIHLAAKDYITDELKPQGSIRYIMDYTFYPDKGTYNITRDHMAAFSPYHTEHLGRLGSFEADLTKKVKPMTFELLVE